MHEEKCNHIYKCRHNSIKWKDGFIISPESPGLGIEFDEELARDNSYSGTSLHLEMQEDPCNYKNKY